MNVPIVSSFPLTLILAVHFPAFVGPYTPRCLLCFGSSGFQSPGGMAEHDAIAMGIVMWASGGAELCQEAGSCAKHEAMIGDTKSLWLAGVPSRVLIASTSAASAAVRWRLVRPLGR